MGRLSFVCALVAFSSFAAAQESSQAPAAMKLADAKFVILSNQPDCMTVAVERGDPAKGPSSVLVKMTPSCDSRTHWHSADASVLAVSGTTQLDMKGEKSRPMMRGDFVFMPAHHIHRERCTGTVPCVFYAELYSPFDVHYVDTAGNEIPDAEALRGAKKSPR
jgi:gentisate 1,2-dioxygenase